MPVYPLALMKAPPRADGFCGAIHNARAGRVPLSVPNAPAERAPWRRLNGSLSSNLALALAVAVCVLGYGDGGRYVVRVQIVARAQCPQGLLGAFVYLERYAVIAVCAEEVGDHLGQNGRS